MQRLAPRTENMTPADHGRPSQRSETTETTAERWWQLKVEGGYKRRNQAPQPQWPCLKLVMDRLIPVEQLKFQRSDVVLTCSNAPTDSNSKSKCKDHARSKLTIAHVVARLRHEPLKSSELPRIRKVSQGITRYQKDIKQDIKQISQKVSDVLQIHVQLQDDIRILSPCLRTGGQCCSSRDQARGQVDRKSCNARSQAQHQGRFRMRLTPCTDAICYCIIYNMHLIYLIIYIYIDLNCYKQRLYPACMCRVSVNELRKQVPRLKLAGT